MRIETKQDLKRVLKLEEQKYHKKWYFDLPFRMTEQQILYKHAKYLRKAEYACNSHKMFRHVALLKLLRLQTQYGISIPLNVLEEGFEMVHLGSVIINADAKIGKNCRIHPGVCIGANHGLAPQIGSGVYIGPGAKVFGNIVIEDDIQIGANAVVNKSCEEKGAVLVGNPARVITSRE